MASIDDVAGELTQARIDIAELRVELRQVLRIVGQHEDRLQALDQWRWRLAGVGAAAGITGATASTIVAQLFT